MDCSLPCSSVHGIFQARVLGWGAIAFSVSIIGISQIHFIESSVVVSDFCFYRSEVVPEKVFSDKDPDDCAFLTSHITSDDGLRTTI